MSFFAILFGLLIEQVRPLARGNPIHSGLRSWARWVAGNFDAGKPHHGWVAWTLAVAGPALASLVIHAVLLVYAGWFFAMLWSVAVLYVTLGFRQFSHHFTNIRDALDAGDEARARELLAHWQQVDASELPRSEIVRHVIEYSVLAAHRHVFGVLACFSVLAAFGLGPAGAVLYRMSEFVDRVWRHAGKTSDHPVSPALLSVASRAWGTIDWLPARITALGFAVVGSFEEAIDCWRNYAQRFPNDNDGVILAATSGAVNVRLGGEALKAAVFAPGQTGGFGTSGVESQATLDSTESTPGREAEVGHLRSIVGLVWRSVVLWMVLLALLTLARLLG
ncbi:MAG: putative rane protein distantly related to cobalamin biosynthesis protein [Ramlibacter sp.]|nr:putative rane protein distantly related to cobalamin biosynthesis protein [Ramlibacter sp.]